MGCGDFSAEWELIGPLLPPERGRWASPAGDNRCFFNGMLHGLRVDCPSAMCMSATANGTRSSSVPTTDGAMRLGGSFANAGRSRVSQTTGSTSSTAPAFAATLGSGRRRGLVRTRLIDHAPALRSRSTSAATIRNRLSASSCPATRHLTIQLPNG